MDVVVDRKATPDNGVEGELKKMRRFRVMLDGGVKAAEGTGTGKGKEIRRVPLAGAWAPGGLQHWQRTGEPAAAGVSGTAFSGGRWL